MYCRTIITVQLLSLKPHVTIQSSHVHDIPSNTVCVMLPRKASTTIFLRQDRQEELKLELQERYVAQRRDLEAKSKIEGIE